MTELTSYAPGTFCWLDLGTGDPKREIAFYTQLLGVTAKDLPAGEGAVYTMLQLRGLDVAAIYELGENDPSRSFSGWASYVSVASADESAKKAVELGGKIVSGPFDVMDAGRMAMVADPEGAMFALWEPRRNPGAGVANEPGSWCWNELWTRDKAGAIRFYTSLFGWTAKESPGYVEWHAGDDARGGMFELLPGMDAPAMWTVYFCVADCDASAKEIERLGGHLHMPPKDIEHVGRFAMGSDPQGTIINILALNRG
jgi:hypothetical protein